MIWRSCDGLTVWQWKWWVRVNIRLLHMFWTWFLLVNQSKRWNDDPESSFATDKLQEFHSCFPDLLGGINQWVLWTTSYWTVKRCNKAGFLLSLTSKMKVIGKSSLILRSPYMGKLSTCWSPPVFPCFSSLRPFGTTGNTLRPPGWRPFGKIAPSPSARPGSPIPRNSVRFRVDAAGIFHPSTYHMVLTHIAMENGWKWSIFSR